MRTELDDAGLGPERVDELFLLYEEARREKEMKQEAPAAPLAEADEPENGNTQQANLSQVLPDHGKSSAKK